MHSNIENINGLVRLNINSQTSEEESASIGTPLSRHLLPAATRKRAFVPAQPMFVPHTPHRCQHQGCEEVDELSIKGKSLCRFHAGLALDLATAFP